MRKSAFCICKNKGPDQLHGNGAADRGLCFSYIDSCLGVFPRVAPRAGLGRAVA